MSNYSQIASIIAASINPLINRVNNLEVNTGGNNLIYKIKTSNDTISNDQILDNDADLFINIPTQTTESYYRMELKLSVIGAPSADMQLTFVETNSSPTTELSYGTDLFSFFTSTPRLRNFGDIQLIPLTSGGNLVTIAGFVIVPANESPTIQLQWAQDRAETNTLTLNKGSFMSIEKIEEL